MADASSPAAAIPLPPDGTNFIEVIRPGLTFIMIATPLAAMLVPVIILLYFFSTPASRQTVVFNLNVFICLLGLLLAFLNDALEWKQILYPLVPIPDALFLATIVVSVMLPLFVDSVLLTRIVAFYPSHRTTVQQRVKVLALPVVCKIIRFIMLCIYFDDYHRKGKNLGSVALAGSVTWFRNPYITTEWTLQIIDNSYSSIFFLYKLQLFNKRGRAGWMQKHQTTLKRIRGFFYIALGNFVFPVIFNIVQIILITSDRDFLHGTYLIFVNDYVAILGVVFATVWTSSAHWKQNLEDSSASAWNNSGGRGYNRSNDEDMQYKTFASGIATAAETRFDPGLTTVKTVDDSELEMGAVTSQVAQSEASAYPSTFTATTTDVNSGKGSPYGVYPLKAEYLDPNDASVYGSQKQYSPYSSPGSV